MKKKLFFYLNIIIAGLVFIGNYFYLTKGGLLLKGLCNGGFALMSIINLIDALIERSAKLNFHIIMAIGLILAMLGDIFLGFNFILDAGLFASGHICFAVSYCVLQKFNKLDLLLAGILFAATGSFVLFCPLLTFSDGVMQGGDARYTR